MNHLVPDSLESLSNSRLFTTDGKLIDETVQLDKEQVRRLDKAPGLENTVIDQKYRIIGLLGEVGMGSGYKALHLNLDKVVALKTLITPHITHELWKRF